MKLPRSKKKEVSCFFAEKDISLHYSLRKAFLESL